MCTDDFTVINTPIWYRKIGCSTKLSINGNNGCILGCGNDSRNIFCSNNISSTANDWTRQNTNGSNISIDGNKACIIDIDNNLSCSNNITSQNNTWTLNN